MKKIVTFFVVVVLGGIGFSFYRFSKNGKLVPPAQIVIEDDEEVIPLEPVVEPEIKRVDSTTNTFTHKKYNFSFNYPSNIKTSNFNEGDGEQILFQGDNNEWFQIYITPWDEEGDITAERIKQDLPDIVITSPQKAILGPKQKEGIGPHALIFYSKDSSLGDTREVWFVRNGNLYQITTYKKLDTMIGQILSSIVFN